MPLFIQGLQGPPGSTGERGLEGEPVSLSLYISNYIFLIIYIYFSVIAPLCCDWYIFESNIYHGHLIIQKIFCWKYSFSTFRISYSQIWSCFFGTAKILPISILNNDSSVLLACRNFLCEWLAVLKWLYYTVTDTQNHIFEANSVIKYLTKEPNSTSDGSKYTNIEILVYQ